MDSVRLQVRLMTTNSGPIAIEARRLSCSAQQITHANLLEMPVLGS